MIATPSVPLHVNYVVEFADGTAKVGVTTRMPLRISELSRSTRCAGRPVRCMHTPPASRSAAFKTEADLCRLLAYRCTAGTREWFRVDASSHEFDYLAQTTGMFWQMNAVRHGAYRPQEFLL